MALIRYISRLSDRQLALLLCHGLPLAFMFASGSYVELITDAGHWRRWLEQRHQLLGIAPTLTVVLLVNAVALQACICLAIDQFNGASVVRELLAAEVAAKATATTRDRSAGPKWTTPAPAAVGAHEWRWRRDGCVLAYLTAVMLQMLWSQLLVAGESMECLPVMLAVAVLSLSAVLALTFFLRHFSRAAAYLNCVNVVCNAFVLSVSLMLNIPKWL